MSVSTRTEDGRGGRDQGSLRSKSPWRRSLLALLTCALAALALPAAAAAIDEFPLPPGSHPGSITTGPDGALWFTMEGTSQISRMTTTGVVTNTFNIPTGPEPAAEPPLDQIVTGPDGALWFTKPRNQAIGRITTAGAITEYTSGISASPEGITVGPDNHIWFTETGLNQIGELDPSGLPNPGVVEYGPTGSGPSDITAGPDGRMWFTESGANTVGAIPLDGPASAISHYGPTGAEPSGITNTGAGLWFTESSAAQIAQITTAGGITEYPGAGDQPSAITAAHPPGGDGALWFTESGSNAIGRITTGGVITNHFPVPTLASEPSDITQGPDGNIWFTEFLGDRIGRVVVAPPVVVPPPPPPVALVPKPKPKKCKVPKVRGLTVKKAIKKLKKARCKYKVKGKGRVVKTSPKAGKRTSKTVKVTASRKRSR
jgi:virginiamycin B lyase